MQASSPNFLAAIWIICSCFLMSEWAFNNIKSLPHHCCWSKTAFFYSSNNMLFLSPISAKIMSRKVFILFNWSFLLQMWNKWFNIVIYCLPPLYLAMKAIFPLWLKIILTSGPWLKSQHPLAFSCQIICAYSLDPVKVLHFPRTFMQTTGLFSFRYFAYL